MHAARITRVGRYLAITGGVRVNTSPTVLVIGPNQKARTITGFTSTRELDAVVGGVVSAND